MDADVVAPEFIPDEIRGSDSATAIRAMLLRLDLLRADGLPK